MALGRYFIMLKMVIFGEIENNRNNIKYEIEKTSKYEKQFKYILTNYKHRKTYSSTK